jgi:hypothetical protein
MTRSELEQLETLLSEIKAGHVDTAIEWLEAAVQVARKQIEQERNRFDAYGC